MASQFDDSDFVDRDYEAAHRSGLATAAVAPRPPTREELDAKVSDAQQKLIELRRVQEELERERVALEEARRRRSEFQTGREEMIHHLTRGVGLLEENEFATRQTAEQLAKSLTGLREALDKVQAIHEDAWTQENWSTELTRALTTVENARMEWNTARLKWPLLSGETANPNPRKDETAANFDLRELSFLKLCRIGLALNWPLALVAAAGLGTIIVLLLQRP